MTRFNTIMKISAGALVTLVVAVLQTLILLALLPSRTARIKSCIVFERLVGYSLLWLSGCRLTVTGAEHLDPKRPAIYAVNHTSLIDLFIVLRIMPSNGVGIVKKEVIYYPIFGQMYLLTGHLRIDRGKRESAVKAMRSLGVLVRKAKLSIMISPEGTRSRDGRLQPFKKGMIHLALQTGLPIVPIVVHGAHKSWVRNTMTIRGVKIRADVLPAIDSSAWSADDTDAALEQVRRVFCETLSPEQRPPQLKAAVESQSS